MPTTIVPAGTDNAPVFDLCDVREKRFLDDLIEQEERGRLATIHFPNCTRCYGHLSACGVVADVKELRVPPMLMYYLVVYAMMAHHIPEDVEGWRRGGGHEVYAILQGFMEREEPRRRQG